MSLLEWGAVLFNVLYVILAARRHVACWPVGMIGVILAFFVYISARLYSDATLQVVYLGLSVYGWWQWTRSEATLSSRIKRMDLGLHLRMIGIGLLAGLAMGWFWSFFQAALPFIDGLTTSFSLLTTWLVAQRYLDNWLYWIVIDVVCIGVYVDREIDAFVYLFIMYTLLAMWGWWKWRTSMLYDGKQHQNDST